MSSIFYFLIFAANYVHANEYPKIWNVPRHNKSFTGREDFLKLISKDINQNKDMILAIVGTPGIGKTQIAKKYAELNKNKYDIIWWINADNNINEQYRMLAIAINELGPNKNLLPTYSSEDILLAQVKNHLRLTQDNWLLIFDNSASEEAIDRYIPERHHKSRGNVLITSKNSSTWGNAMKLEKFNRKESLEYFRKALINYNEKDKDALDKLSELLGDYPLALSQGIAYMNNTETNVQKYIDLFTTKRTELWEKEKQFKDENSNLKEFDHYKDSIFTALALSINSLKAQSPSAFNLLILCSFLDNEDIPGDFLKFAAKLDQKAELDFIDDLTKLKHYSILHSKKTNNELSSKEAYSMHGLIQIVALDLLNEHQYKESLQYAQSAMAQYLPDQIENLGPLFEKYPSLAKHIKELNNHSQKIKEINENVIFNLVRLLEYYLLIPLDYQAANDLILEISNNIQEIKVSELLLAQFYHIKSIYSSWYECDKNKAITELEKSLQLIKAYPSRTEDLLNINLQLAQSYIFKCDVEGAEQYLKVAESIILQNDKSVKKGLFHIVKALCEMNKGNFDTALHDNRLAIKIEQSMGIDKSSPGEIPFYILESEILLKQEKYTEALKISQNLLAKVQEFYKEEEHELASRVMIILASAALHTGDVTLAKDSITKAISILKNSHLVDNANNPDIDMANALIVSADVHAQEKEYLGANKIYLQAEEIFKSLFIDAKTDDVSYLYSRLALNGLNLNDSYQVDHYLKAHKEKFGEKNPRTQKIIEAMVKKGL